MGGREAEIYDLLVKGLSDASLFPKINWNVCASCNSYQRAMTLPPIREMTRLLEEARLKPRVGFNQGTGEISFLVALPPDEKFLETPRQAVLLCMLGVLRSQAIIESLHSAAALTEGGSVEVMSNRCLQLLMEQAGVAVIQRQLYMVNRTMRLVFESSSRGVKRALDGSLVTDSNADPFWFSPSYNYLSGYDPASDSFCVERLEQQTEELLDSMVAEFWSIVESLNYFPDRVMRGTVTKELRDFVLTGVKGQSRRFRPQSKRLMLYLQGTAGIGKSSFVRVFCAALQRLLRKRIDPKTGVDIVKVGIGEHVLTFSSLSSFWFVDTVHPHTSRRVFLLLVDSKRMCWSGPLELGDARELSKCASRAGHLGLVGRAYSRAESDQRTCGALSP